MLFQSTQKAKFFTVSFIHYPQILHLKFGLNRVSNSWDIADIEFVWWVVSHFGVKSNFWSELRLSWGCDNSQEIIGRRQQAIVSDQQGTVQATSNSKQLTSERLLKINIKEHIYYL